MLTVVCCFVCGGRQIHLQNSAELTQALADLLETHPRRVTYDAAVKSETSASTLLGDQIYVFFGPNDATRPMSVQSMTNYLRKYGGNRATFTGVRRGATTAAFADRIASGTGPDQVEFFNSGPACNMGNTQAMQGKHYWFPAQLYRPYTQPQLNQYGQYTGPRYQYGQCVNQY